MPPPCIENEFQYRTIRARIAALRAHLTALTELQDRARADRRMSRIEDEDLQSLAPLEDARADVNWTCERLRDAAGEWEDLVEYGRRRT